MLNFRTGSWSGAETVISPVVIDTPDPWYGPPCALDAYLSAGQPPMTRVCRQMREEALGLFYGINNFGFRFTSRGDKPRVQKCIATRWLRCIGSTNVERVKGIVLPSCWLYTVVEIREIIDWSKDAGMPGRLLDTMEDELERLTELATSY